MAQLPAPTGLNARFIGAAGGSSSYYYWIQALYPDGWSALSGYASVANAQSGLTSGNRVQINWSPAPGAIAYYVYKTTTTVPPAPGSNLLFIGDAQTGCADTGQALMYNKPTFSGLLCARATYDFSKDGGAIGAIALTQADVIPAQAVCVLGYVVIGEANAVTGAGASIAIGTPNGSGGAILLAATAITSFTEETFIALLGTIATPIVVPSTQAGPINMTVSAAALTAGIFEIVVFYFILSNVFEND